MYYGYIITKSYHGHINTYRTKIYSGGLGLLERSSLILSELQTTHLSQTNVEINFKSSEPLIKHTTLTTQTYYDVFDGILISTMKSLSYIDGTQSNINTYVQTINDLNVNINLETEKIYYTYVMGKLNDVYSDVYVISYLVPVNVVTTYFLRKDYEPPKINDINVTMLPI
jgi:hypothetical protein